MEMRTHQTNFSTGNVYRNIMEVAVPMIIAQILNLLYNIVDRIYIGRIPEIGATALTGVGLCFPIITLITAFTYLFGNGGAPLCSMERGRGNEKEAEMLMGNTFVMLIGTGVILTVTGLLFYRPILYVFGASDVTFPYASGYIKIYLLGTLSVMVTLGMNPFINSQGFGNMGMLTILIGAVLNIVLDPLFIFVFHMGVRGAAAATIISQFCSAVWVLRFLCGKKAVLTLKKSAMIISGKRVKDIISLGMSGFFMALQFTGQSVFVALGKAKRATFFSLLRKAFIVVPLTILLPYVNGLGTDGVFWAEPISNLAGGCACFFTMLATVLPELNGKTKPEKK